MKFLLVWHCHYDQKHQAKFRTLHKNKIIVLEAELKDLLSRVKDIEDLIFRENYGIMLYPGDKLVLHDIKILDDSGQMNALELKEAMESLAEQVKALTDVLAKEKEALELSLV